MRVLIVEDDVLLGQALADGPAPARPCGRLVHQRLPTPMAPWWPRPTMLMVLDLGLPGGDGMVWLRRWRDRGVKLPVLVLTARDGVDQRIAGLDAGADDYLLKPITIDELAARLRALMRRATGRAQPTWQHGALEYEPAAKRVRWKGQPVDLDGTRTGAARGLAARSAACAVQGDPAREALRLERHRAGRQLAGGPYPPSSPQDRPGHRANGARRRLCAGVAGAVGMSAAGGPKVPHCSPRGRRHP